VSVTIQVLTLSRRKQGFESLGSANDFSILAPEWSLDWPTSPTFLQWTVRFRRSVRGHAVVRSKRLETIWAVTAVGGIDAYFLTLTHAHNAALPAEQIEHPPVYEKTERAVLSSLCRWVCRRVGSRCAEARRNRSPRYLRGTKPRAPNLHEDHDVARAADPLFGAEVELHHPESSSRCGWIPDPLVPLVAAQRRRHSLLHAPESHPANA
jgi:hypothetical protein